MDERLDKLGAYELMQILHELHKMGYQKLRWMSYMAPTGCNLRCHITTQDNICVNQEICWSKDGEVFASSVNNMTTGEDILPFVKVFMDENPRLLEIGKGEDSDYAEWFDKVLSKASKGYTPMFNGEWWSLPIGKILLGDEPFPGPPMRMRLISWNIDGIKAHFDALKQLIKEYSPEVICLQKVKDIKDSQEFELDGYRRECSSAPYAGVVTYVKECIPCNRMVISDNHIKGHIIKTEFLYPYFTLYNIYTPYSNPNVEGAVELRKYFDAKLKKLVNGTPDRIIICGDLNIVDTKHDCWDGKHERNQANFHDWERNNFDQLMLAGNLVDTYRILNPFGNDFSYFFRNDPEVRKKNHGHRIDYFLASRSFVPSIERAEIIKDYTVTTNNPILLEFKY